MADTKSPILILGAGINGAAVARELILNGVGVRIVDTADLASGATAHASRLIHGGLRYLEYGEFDLVRESLAERTRLLKLAPQFVRPLELFIPVGNRFGGVVTSVRRFLGWERHSYSYEPPPARGLWLVRMGLWMYDKYARDPTLPHHRVHHLHGPDVPRVNGDAFRWLCSYYDGQIIYPERFVLALLEDARRLAMEQGVTFELLTYHEAHRHGRTIEVFDRSPESQGAAEPVVSWEPAAIINATGAWVDMTLKRLEVPAKRQMGGTKGSHYFTAHQGLRDALGGNAIYAEAADGRPFFVLPFCSGTLVGTTDIPYEGDPRDAVASDEELEYLLASTNHVVPGLELTADDVDMYYCGVRPLPYVDSATTGGITRRHWMERHTDTELPLYSIIGGKLTTCRSLAEESAGRILRDLGSEPTRNSRDRAIPGGANYPADHASVAAEWDRLAKEFGCGRDQIEAVWALCGTRTAEILEGIDNFSPEPVAGTALPREFVRWVIRHEWATMLDDLVERRLMLLFMPGLTAACLRELAELLVEAGRLPAAALDDAVHATIARLETRHGKRVATADAAV